MALGLSLSLGSLPGVGSLLSKLDSYKAAYLAVPNRVNQALDKLVLVQQAMASNGAPPSAQSDALTTKQHLQQVQSEWQASAGDFSKLQNLGGSIGLDTITTAGKLLSSVTYVLGNMNTLESSVDALASKYLTKNQQQAVNQKFAQGIGGISLGTIALVGLGVYFLSRRRNG